jgi:hypothetical protein
MAAVTSDYILVLSEALAVLTGPGVVIQIRLVL